MKKQNYLKGLLAFLLLMVGAAPSLAEAVTPTLEVNFRAAEGLSSWTTAKEASETNNLFEINHNSRFFALQRYEVANLDRAKTIRLSLYAGSGHGVDALAIWVVPNTTYGSTANFSTSWSSSTATGDVASAYSSVTGVTLGASGTTTTTYLLKDMKSSNNNEGDLYWAYYDITGDNLQKLKNNASYDGTTGTFTILITNQSSVVAENASSKRQYYSSGHTTTANRPTIEVTSSYKMSMTTDGGASYTGYDEFNTSLNNAIPDDKNTTINIYENVNLTQRVEAPTSADYTVTIVPQADVSISASKSIITFLSNSTHKGNITAGSDSHTLTIAYSAATTSPIEAASTGTISLTKVTFSGISTTENTGIIKANGGTVKLKDVTFSNCTSTGSPSCIIYNSKEDGVMLDGAINFTGCTAGEHIYANKRIRLGNGGDSYSTITASATPITIKWAGASTMGTSIIVKASASMLPYFSLVDTDNYLGLAHKSSSGDIYLTQVYTLSISEAGAATLVLPFESTIPTGITASKLTYQADNFYVEKVDVATTLPADTPVLIEGTAGTYKFVSTAISGSAATGTDEKTVDGYVLTGVYSNTEDITSGDYLLSGGLFLKSSSGTVAANQAYIKSAVSDKPFLAIGSGTDYSKAFVVPGVGSYDTLGDAVTNVTGGGTIYLQADANVSSRVTFNKDVTIKALSGTPILTRNATDLLYNISGDYTVTFDGITFNEADNTSKKLLEINGGSQKFELKNVTIKNAKYAGSSTDQGLIDLKNGSLELNTVTIKDSEIGSGRAYIRTNLVNGTAANLVVTGLTMDNSTGSLFFIRKADGSGARYLDASKLTGTLPTTIGVAIEDNTPIISNVEDQTAADKFTLATAGYLKTYDSTAKTITFSEDNTGAFKIDGKVGSYATLQAALAALTSSGQTILVQSDATTTMDSRIKFGGTDGYQATVTIKANDGINYTIKRGTQTGVLFNWGGNGTVTFENLTIDNENSSSSKTEGSLLEVDGVSRAYVLKDVIIKNAESTADGGIIDVKTGRLTLNNVTFTDCAPAKAFIRTNLLTTTAANLVVTGLTMDNSTGSLFFIRKADGSGARYLDASKLTGTLPTTIGVAIEDNTPIISNVADETAAGKFTIATEGYLKSYNTTEQTITFSEDNTGAFKIEGKVGSYATLDAALGALPSSGGTILLQNNVTLPKRVVNEKETARVSFGKNVTIKSAGTETYTISRGESTETALFGAGNNKIVKFENVIFDDQNATAGDVFEVNSNTFTLENVTIKNSKSSNASGLIQVKSGSLSLTNVTFTDCAVTGGYIMTKLGSDKAENLVVDGLVFTESTGHMFRLGTGSCLDNSKLTNLPTPISVYIDDKTPMIINVADATAAEKYSVTPDIFEKNYDATAKTITFARISLNLTHPAMLHTAADIERVKSYLSLSPIKESFQHLQQSNYAQPSYTASPVEYLKRMDATNWSSTYSDYNNYTHAMKDANAAYQLALRYQLEGSTACADAAVKILNDWATINKGVLQLDGYTNNIPDPNEYLICIQGHQFANAAELLRDYSGWAAADFTKFKNWMKNTFVNQLAMPFLQNHHGTNNESQKLHYWQNWDLAALTSILSIGILSDDGELTDYAINYYKGTTDSKKYGTGQVDNAVPFLYDEEGTIGLGQCQEAGRDQGHSTLDVALLGAFCQMSKNMGSAGEDLFTKGKSRALKMAEYVGKYNLGQDVPFTTYTTPEYNHTAISAEDRGSVRPTWELYHRYAKDKKLTMKYTQQWVEKLRADNPWGEGGAGDYGSNSTGFDQLGYGTLMYGDPNDVVKIGAIGYPTLAAAVKAAKDGDVLELLADITLEDRQAVGKSVTVKSKDGQTYKIMRGTGEKADQTAMLSVSGSKAVTLDNVTLDDNASTKGILIELKKGNSLTLKNVTVQNSKSTHKNGVISVEGGLLTLDNATFSGCNVSSTLINLAKSSDGVTPSLAVSNAPVILNCVGCLFRLASGVELDATNMVDTQYDFTIADATPTITNVKDEAKFNLKADNYAKKVEGKTISFIEVGDGQDTEITTIPDGYVKLSKVATGDTWVRSSDADKKNGSAHQMEITSKSDGSDDLIGLLTLTLPSEAMAPGSSIEKVQLQFVTKRVKTKNRISIFNFTDFDEATATYSTLSSAIASARGTEPITRFLPKGQFDKDMTSDGASIDESNKTLKAWTNRIDLTSFVKELGSQTVNLLLAESTGDGKAVHFFTKEQGDLVTGDDGKVAFAAEAGDLRPQLIVVYKTVEGEKKAFAVEGEGSFDTIDEALEKVSEGGTILITKDATIGARVNITKDVIIKGKTGSEVLKRSADESAMKQSVLFKANSKKTVTLENFIFDDNNSTVGQLIEVDNNTFVLKNMTVKNSKSSSVNGVVSMKKGTLTVENITFTDCAITNAYLRAAGGTLNFSGSYTLDGSTGNHFRLGDVELNAATLPAIDGAWRIEVESEGAKITNVSDQNKFSLETIGYTKHYANNTITFTEDGDGQDTEEITVPDGYVKNVVAASLDTYVRKGNSSDNGKKQNMEIYTFSDDEKDLDFVGLMAFKLPEDLTKEGAELKKAQLRLVTKRVKGSRIIDMYQLFTDFSESATYDQMESRLADAYDNGRMHRFQARGMSNMDIEADSLKLTDEYKDISLWTNKIDLTATISNVMKDDGILRFALAAPVNANNPKQFYTKEAAGIKNAVMTVSDEYLVPELTLVYIPGTGASALTAKSVDAEANMDLFLRKGSTTDNSISECIEVYTFKDDTKDQDFVGMLSFNLSDEVAAARSFARSRAMTRSESDDLVMFNATLRLVTKRLKGERDMNVFIFDEPFNNQSTYAELESAIADARANNAYVTFKTAGMADKDVTSDAGLSGDYGKSISAWTNMIDVTDLVKNSDSKTLNVMLSAPNNERSPKQYFSSEAESFTNNNYTSFIVSSEDLVPLLTITYRNPLYTDIEERITIPVNEDDIIYDLRGNRVQTAGKGIYIINGKKVLKK